MSFNSDSAREAEELLSSENAIGLCKTYVQQIEHTWTSTQTLGIHNQYILFIVHHGT